ncbi:putative bifunctional diguanylate cyclase/phosphodiesterase [Rubellimicrobium aerolatum]|uniref:Bifunctional diguanylate cyclase/phosphodiesterase n=1 Tax=Rubellimicrobium aerolatum TaxID=490979 RepID=A0ABW0SFL1_9RHOB|nr:diguanylate cyclase (GGDEF)-like protein [Rubellimicrobium aerolatum]
MLHSTPQMATPPDLAEVLDHVSGGVIVVDARGEVAHANAEARTLLAPGRPDAAAVRDLLARLDARARQGRAASQSDPRSGPQFGPRSGPDSPTLVELASGRVVGGAWKARATGGGVLTLVEMGAHLRTLELAHTDPLTGLSNRAELRRRLGDLLAPPQPRALSVLFIDLDRFKAVNDTLGHPMGDALLGKVADRLRSVTRQDDVVARMGGDEFAIIQPGSSGPEASEALAQRLVEVAGRAYAIEGHVLNIGASIGISMAPADGTDPDDLLKKADLALYGAKAAGRNTFRFFDAGMEARLQARRALELELRKALALRQFRLMYQPQVNLATGQVSGFEALLRWVHPERGVVPPADFVPLAEELGVIVPVGEWVLREACREAASWPEGIGVAVNISPVQFRSPRLFDSVAAALTQSRIDPARLELEITEGALLHDTDVVLEVLNRVRSLGVRVSMDDFGTGYSSLSYLQRFPFDRIKIDQSFVRGPGALDDKTAIVRAIASLGASMGMRTTAEGVETAEQMERMRAEGCTEVQGYLTGRPLSPEDVARRLAQPPLPPGTGTIP